MSHKPLNFAPLDSATAEPVKRWKSREAPKTMQTSLRMRPETYDEFRMMCLHERRTNGEMLEVLMNHYKKTGTPDIQR